MYYFRACASDTSRPKLKVGLIMKYVAEEETMCVEAQG